MFRPTSLAAAVFSVTLFSVVTSQPAFSQTEPAFQWIKQIDASGSDTFGDLGVDAVGNTYITGSTYAATFPVKAAVQGHLASAGLYRIDGTGSAYVPLGLTAASSIVVDPQNANTLYAISYATSTSSLLKSVDGGASFSKLSVPSSMLEVLAVNPANDKILYAGTYDKGLFKSTDAGATWTASNGGLQPFPSGSFPFYELWIDPANPNVLLANALSSFFRSTDAGASWQTLLLSQDILSLSFDSATPGVVYASTNLGLVFKSTDDGQTFTSLTTPTPLGAILPDPNRSGRLVAASTGGVYESVDGGSTWTAKVAFGFSDNMFAFVADWANGFFYTGNQYVVRISSDLQTVTPVGPPSIGFLAGIAATNGHAYVAVAGTRDVYVTKLDPSGNVVYSTYFGGTNDDVATAIAVDAAGDVYVTGTTTSGDFPVTKGVYAASGGSFLFKLNPDGSLAYSTYFAPSGNTPAAIATDAAGSAYIGGTSRGNLPVTPGAYQTQCNCPTISTGFAIPSQIDLPRSDLAIFVNGGFLSKFDPTAATLTYSTYIAGTADFANVVDSLAVASDGSAYVGSGNGVFHLNGTGSALLGSAPPKINPTAIAVGPDGNLYIAGAATITTGPNQFQPTAGAFQTSLVVPPPLPNQGVSAGGTGIAKMDPSLATVLDATYFGSSAQVNQMAFDSAGHLYIGGGTAQQGLPTRTPLQGGFWNPTGFVSELSGDLSTLLFSSYFGDNEPFSVGGLAVSKNGSVMLGGSTGQPNNALSPTNIYVNSLVLAPPPALRIDTLESVASLLDGAISSGETIMVRGTGFGASPQLSIGGIAVPAISSTDTTIAAVVPQRVPAGAAEVQVQSGGANSNQVLVSVALASPAIFSQDGSGFGQGYILNKDGTLNKPSNPAAPGDPITIFATGVGPVSFTQGYAVTQFPVNVFVDGIYCLGLAAVMGPVAGFPGSVYQITVYVPDPKTLVAANPNFANFKFPPLVPITMQINGVVSQNGIAISIAQ